MPYLTYEEYISLDFEEMEQSEFEGLVKKASDVLDSVTRYFYRHNDLDKDISFRKEQFKKAVACQIEFFKDMGGTSTQSINSPLTVNMGRTQVMTGAENQKKRNNLIATDVYMYLEGTGLLYRGIGVI